MQKLMTGVAMTLAVLALSTAGLGWIDVNNNINAVDSSLRKERDNPPSKSVVMACRLTPGLGDRMNSIARRFAGLWFAGRSGNRDLALYEIEEIGEVIEEIRMIDPIENGVKVGDVLEAVANTDLRRMKEAVESADRVAFEHAYKATINSCNSCHVSAGHGFIRIKVPDRPPLSNRIYDPR